MHILKKFKIVLYLWKFPFQMVPNIVLLFVVQLSLDSNSSELLISSKIFSTKDYQLHLFSFVGKFNKRLAFEMKLFLLNVK